MTSLFSGGSEGPLLSWLATYAVHSTLILSATWLVFTRSSLGSLRLRDAIWKTALLTALLVISVARSWPWFYKIVKFIWEIFS